MDIKFTKSEKDLLYEIADKYNLGDPPDVNWDYDKAEKFRDAAMDYEVIYGLDSNYEPSEKGKLAISITDKLLKVS